MLIVIHVMEISAVKAQENTRRIIMKEFDDNENKINVKEENLNSKENLDQDLDQISPDESILKKFEAVLGFIKPGYSMAIYRISPSWCKGYLERIEFTEDDPEVDLNYLAETWGGDKLRVRICDSTGTYRYGADLPFYSYPPKLRGRLLQRRKRYDELPEEAEYKDTPREKPAAYVQNFKQNDGVGNLETIINLIKATRAEDLKTLRQLLSHTNVEPKSFIDQFEGFMEMADQFERMKKVFGKGESQLSAADDNSALFRTIGEVAKALTGPRVVHSLPPAQTLARQQPKPNAAAQQQYVDLPKTLADMSPDDAAATYISALARMPESKRVQTIQTILSGLGIEDDLESSDEEENGDYDRTESTLDHQ